jgi:DNA polymerase III subunit beta
VEFYIETSELVLALSRVQGIVNRAAASKSGASTCTHVLIKAAGDEISMVATDSVMMTLSARYESRVVTPGEICVKAKRLFMIAKSLESQAVHLKMKGNHLELKGGKAVFTIAECKNSMDFPPIRDLRISSRISVPSQALKRLIDETIFSIAEGNNRGLNGAHIEHSGDSVLRLVTTDGNRLSLSETAFEGSLDQEASGVFDKMLVPKGALSEIRKLCEGPEEVWTIGFGPKEAEFSNGEIQLQVNLVDGQFPDYKQVLNKLNNNKSAVVSRKALISVFKRVGIFTSKHNNSVSFRFGSDGVVLSTQNPECGDFSEEIQVDYDGNEIEVAFNLEYFQEIIYAISSEYLKLQLGNDLDPCVIRTPDRDECMFIVMPMRINR